MADERQLPQELERVEEALAAITLPSSNIDRDRLMYDAGWAAAETRRAQPQRRTWLWQTAAAVSSVAAIFLLTVLAVRPPAVIREIVYVDRNDAEDMRNAESGMRNPAESQKLFRVESLNSTPTAPHRALGEELNYLQLRELALRDGVNALPAPMRASNTATAASQASPTSRVLLQEWLAEQKAGRAM